VGSSSEESYQMSNGFIVWDLAGGPNSKN